MHKIEGLIHQVVPFQNVDFDGIDVSKLIIRSLSTKYAVILLFVVFIFLSDVVMLRSELSAEVLPVTTGFDFNQFFHLYGLGSLTPFP